MGRIDGKVALVSGAARHMAAQLQIPEEGAIIYAGDVKSVTGAKGIEPLTLDVTKPKDWKNAVDQIAAKHGRIDILINNAGIVRAYGQDTELGEANAVVSVNLTGTFLGMKAVLPIMRKAGKGSIVNFSSIWGNVGVAGAAAYSAGKGGVRNLTKNAAISYAPENVREFRSSRPHSHTPG